MVLVIVGSWWMLFAKKSGDLSAPQTDGQIKLSAKKDILASKTLTTYEDSTGFSFDYPDNLSLTNNQPKNERVYADVNLSSKDTDGSLSLIISQTSFTKLEDWVEANKGESKELKDINLGTLKGKEIVGPDRLLLGAIDQEVLFTMEIKFNQEKDFWTDAYNQVIKSFTFINTSGSTATTNASSDVTFEGEEVVN